MNSSSQFVAN
jgi:hypothetical protein